MGMVWRRLFEGDSGKKVGLSFCGDIVERKVWICLWLGGSGASWFVCGQLTDVFRLIFD